jgi:hypothetical protein
MEQIHFQKTESHADNQEMSCFIWNTKDHYQVHNSLLLDYISNQFNTFLTVTPI